MHDVGKIVTLVILAMRIHRKRGSNVLNYNLQLTILFPTELYSYTEEWEFKFNREAFEITAYSQGNNGN